MKRNLILLSLVLIFLMGCSTKPISIYPVKDESMQTIAAALKEKEAGGFFFSLPRTVINVDTTIEVKSQTTGKYYKALALYDAYQKVTDLYTPTAGENDGFKKAVGDDSYKKMIEVLSNVARIVENEPFSKFKNESILREAFRDYFNKFIQRLHEDYVKENKTTYKIEKGTISISSEPDPKKLFFAMIPKGKLESKGITLTLTEQGTPSSALASSTNNSFDYAFATVKTIASIAATASVALSKSGLDELPEENLNKLFKEKYRTIMRYGLKMLAYANGMETDIKIMQKDAETYWHLNSQLEKLLTGDAIQTAEAYAGIIKPIQDRMSEIKQKFTGSSKKDSKTTKARIIPATPADIGDKKYKQTCPLFAYNEDGFFFFDGYTTDKVCVSSVNGTEDGDKFKIRLSTNTKPFKTSPIDAMKKIQALYANASDKYPYGIPFNVPGLVKIEAIVEGKSESVLKTEVCHLSQFGTTGHMPHCIDGKSSQYTLTYFQDTGAINVMEIGSTGFDSSNVTAAGDAITTLLKIETARLQEEVARVTAKQTIEDAK